MIPFLLIAQLGTSPLQVVTPQVAQPNCPQVQRFIDNIEQASGMTREQKDDVIAELTFASGQFCN